MIDYLIYDKKIELKKSYILKDINFQFSGIFKIKFEFILNFYDIYFI